MYIELLFKLTSPSPISVHMSLQISQCSSCRACLFCLSCRSCRSCHSFSFLLLLSAFFFFFSFLVFFFYFSLFLLLSLSTSQYASYIGITSVGGWLKIAHIHTSRFIIFPSFPYIATYIVPCRSKKIFHQLSTCLFVFQTPPALLL